MLATRSPSMRCTSQPVRTASAARGRRRSQCQQRPFPVEQIACSASGTLSTIRSGTLMAVKITPVASQFVCPNRRIPQGGKVCVRKTWCHKESSRSARKRTPTGLRSHQRPEQVGLPEGSLSSLSARAFHGASKPVAKKFARRPASGASIDSPPRGDSRPAR